MSSITTAARWIELPTATGLASSWRQDQPLSSGLVQVASSNATHAARENGLRTLYDHPGVDTIQASLLWDSLDGFPWDADPADPAGAPLVLFGGVHRLRFYGETGRYPSIVLRARLAAPTGYTAGVVMVARAGVGRPSSADLRGSATTTSSALTDVVVSLAPTATFNSRRVVPRIGSASPAPEPPEVGEEHVFALYLGAWRTGGVGTWKAAIAGITVYLVPPS